VRALKKRYGDRHLAAGRRRQLQKRAHGDDESQKKLAAVRRGIVARCIGRGHTGPTVERGRRKTRTRDNVARGTSKGWTFEKRHPVQPECNSGIRHRDLKVWQCLGSVRTSGRIIGKTIVKRTVGSSVRIPKTCQNIVELANSRTNEETAQSLKARHVGTPATLGSFARTDRKRMAVCL
jgi:hypothetical protein